MKLNKLQKPSAAKVSEIYREDLQQGKLNVQTSFRLNWHRFVLLAVSTEIVVLLAFAHGTQIFLHFYIGLSGHSDIELFTLLALRFVSGYVSLLLMFLTVGIPLELIWSPDRIERNLMWVIASLFVLTTSYSVILAYLVAEWTGIYEFEIIKETTYKFVSNFLAFTFIFIQMGTSLSFSHYARLAQMPKIFDKIPPDCIGEIVYIQALDKKVMIVTEGGEAEVTMSMGDAITASLPAKGLRIHRSFWVSERFIKNPFKEGRRWFMSVGGAKISVSQKYINDLEG